jgi:hypothetical protein
MTSFNVGGTGPNQLEFFSATKDKKWYFNACIFTSIKEDQD